ncbi:MAG: SRPBCC domain-containing protein [Actinomycetota bacterium]|nr:SRPBCC domain-containing protein [Actinomycetota bacterium]
MSDDRAINLSVEVPGTPEEVWRAIATSGGISSWFVPFEVAEAEGGAVTMDFGEYGKESAEVTAWEPPERFEYGSSGVRPLVYEWLVEAKDGGSCVVRLVNRGFGHGDDWDADFEGMQEGWLIFLENLRLHLTHFPGRTARPILPTVMVPGPNDAAFAAVCDVLGVPTDLKPGDELRVAGDGVASMAGRIDHVEHGPKRSQYTLLLDEPASGTAFIAAEGAGEQVAVSVWLYLYGDGVDEIDDDWTPFLTARFPVPDEVPTAG